MGKLFYKKVFSIVFLMKEIILCKYGELVLKGANKTRFESMLLRRIRARAERFGKAGGLGFKVYRHTNLHAKKGLFTLEIGADFCKQGHI